MKNKQSKARKERVQGERPDIKSLAMERHREGFMAELLKWDILQQRGSCGLDA